MHAYTANGKITAFVSPIAAGTRQICRQSGAFESDIDSFISHLAAQHSGLQLPLLGERAGGKASRAGRARSVILSSRSTWKVRCGRRGASSMGGGVGVRNCIHLTKTRPGISFETRPLAQALEDAAGCLFCSGGRGRLFCRRGRHWTTGWDWAGGEETRGARTRAHT